MAYLGGENFVNSGDQSYNHPAAGAGGFGGGDETGRTLGSTGLDTSSTDQSSYGASNTGGRDFTGDSSEYSTGAGRGGATNTAETIASYGGGQQSSGYSGDNSYRSGDNQSSGYGDDNSYRSGNDTSYGTSGVGAGLGTDLDSARGSSGQNYGSSGLRDAQSEAQNFSSQHSGSNSGQGAAYGAAGAGAAGAAAYGAKKLDSDPSSGGYSSSGAGGDNAKNLTGDSRVDDTIGKKIEENTDEDGFTNLTGDKEPVGGLFTGRVKNDSNNRESPIVETNKERSKRDSKGRELDSYGRPYDL